MLSHELGERCATRQAASSQAQNPVHVVPGLIGRFVNAARLPTWPTACTLVIAVGPCQDVLHGNGRPVALVCPAAVVLERPTQGRFKSPAVDVEPCFVSCALTLHRITDQLLVP